jgi:hypothetical protein
MQELEEQIHEESKALVRDEEKYRKISEVHDRGAE